MNPTAPAPGVAPARRELRVVPEVLTWDVCALRVVVGTVSFIVCVAGDEYPEWMERFAAGALDDELRGIAANPPVRALRRVPRSVRTARRVRPPRVGIEHEFALRQRGAAVDFRTVLPALFPDLVRADPADPFAVRHHWGVVTADAAEAEIATLPIPVCAGFAERASAAAADAQERLREACPSDLEFSGYSTHISVSWSPRRDDWLSQRWARTFGPAMMLLLDSPASPGLLVRPRPGRLELCGEYCDGSRLAASVAFAAASAAHLLRVGPKAMRPYVVDAVLQPARNRYGWYLDRACFGDDLYRPDARLRRSGRAFRASDHLDQLVALVAPDLHRIGGTADVELMHRITARQIHLPLLDRMEADHE